MLAFLYDSPVWLVILSFLLVGLVFASVCALGVRRLVTPAARERHSELISFCVTNVAVLYGVLLAFLAVAAWESFTKASESASVEAGLVHNLFHDTQGMAPPMAADLRGHVLDYLHTIIEVEWPMQVRGETPTAGQVALAKLHRHVTVLTPGDVGDTVLMGDMLQVLNKLDTARAARLESIGGRIPSLIWVLIVSIGFLTVGLATVIPAESLTLQIIMVGALALSIVLVLVMIVELDNPFRGSISVSAEAYQAVLHDIEQPQAADDTD
jgi:hypothetical protein